MRGESSKSALRWLQGVMDPRIAAHLSDLSALAVWLENQLPSPLREECRPINLRASTLVIGVNSPVWAARIRFQTSGLLAAAQRDLPYGVRKIQVKVLPARPEQTPSTKRAVRISPDTAELLRQTARNVDHPKLSAALSRVAARAAQS